MFDKLEDLLLRFEDVLNELNEPSVVNDQVRFRKLMKEQNDLQPIVDAYREYKKCKETVEESLQMLEEENDEEMREMLKEELRGARERISQLERTLPRQAQAVRESLSQLCDQFGQLLVVIDSLSLFQLPQMFLS